MPIGINEGTQTFLKSTTSGTTEVSHVQAESGTIGVVSSVAKLEGGTLGNLNFGTFDTFYRHPDSFATIVSQSGTKLGTIKAAVSGSAHYITDMTISAQTACTAVLYAGSTLPRAGTYFFADTGGLVNNSNTPITIESGSEITFSTVGTGLVTLEIRGYVD